MTEVVEGGVQSQAGMCKNRTGHENSPPAQAEGAKFELRRGTIIAPAADAGLGIPRDATAATAIRRGIDAHRERDGRLEKER